MPTRSETVTVDAKRGFTDTGVDVADRGVENNSGAFTATVTVREV